MIKLSLRAAALLSAALFASGRVRAAGVEGGEADVSAFQRLAALDARNAGSEGLSCNFQCVVTHASLFRPGLIIVASSDKPYQGGRPVTLADGSAMPAEGDEIWIKGRTRGMFGHIGVANATFVKAGDISLDFETVWKYADFRKGLLDFRRITVAGTVKGESREEVPGIGVFRILRLETEKNIVHVRVPGGMDGPGFEGRRVSVTGCVFPAADAEGAILSRCIETSRTGGVEALDDGEVFRQTVLRCGAVVLASALLAALAALLHSRRERLKMSVVLAERKRMATDLHDTIEQHLASARLVLAGVSADASLSPRSRELVARAGEILMRAKTETRDAVLRLRSDESPEKSPAASILEVARGLAKGGVAVKTLLRGLPSVMSQGRRHDLVSIVREAATNAVKHGKAKRILIVSDPKGAGFALRILNDGEIFDPGKALGPETGHFGLAGMRERAVRSSFALSIVREKFGMCVRVEGEPDGHSILSANLREKRAIDIMFPKQHL